MADTDSVMAGDSMSPGMAMIPALADLSETQVALDALRTVDGSRMLDAALDSPRQILGALSASVGFSEGDPPLDRSCIQFIGLGGSAISGELVLDMLSPHRFVQVHRGIQPPRDKCGIVLSSYSGATSEILELSRVVTGGLRTTIVFTSGGQLLRTAQEIGMPVWHIPPGYQPRAAVGWSVGFLGALLERWRVTSGVVNRMQSAAKRLARNLEATSTGEHLLVRAALPLARASEGRAVAVFHSGSCTGAAARFAAQINENAKQPAFTVAMPEGLHNTVQGIAGADPSTWSLIFLSDEDDTPSLREGLNRAMVHLSRLGFTALPFPHAGDDKYERTLSRLLLADLTSLFIAAGRKIDPAPIGVISALKQEGTATDGTIYTPVSK